MRNLFRIAFALALAACGEQTRNAVDCDLDPSLPGCEQVEGCAADADCDDGDDCTLDDCVESTGRCSSVNVCEALPSGDALMFINDNGSAFFGLRFDDSPGFADFITADEEQLASIPQNSCIETPFPDIEGDPTLRSVGNVQLQRGGAILTDLAANDADPIYEDVLDPGVASLGDELDVVLSGSDVIDAATLSGLLAVPPAFPALNFIDPQTGQLALTPTLSFAPLEADHVIVRFNFVEGQTGVTISCRADGISGSATIDGPTFDRLPASGSMSIVAFNRTFRVVSTADGESRSIRGTAQTSDNVQYTK